MKKFLSILMVGLFVLSGFGAVTFSQEIEDVNIEHQTLTISSPIITEQNEFVNIDIPESTSKLMSTGKPMLPIITKTYTYPVGTQITDVKVSMDTKRTTVQKQIYPAPKPVALTTENIDAAKPEITLDQSIYKSSSLYPAQSYDVRTGIGIHQDERVLYLNVDCYAQYQPTQNVVYVPEKIDISISYKLPETTFFTNSEYDLLIITDEKFVDDMQPLVDHKNNLGIRTIMETTQDIYDDYDGRDQPEDIKLRIYDAVQDLGIKYVLLAGGHIGQTDEWYIPERIVTNDDNSGYETGYASDLYYADVIKKNQYGIPEFEDWDSDGDGLFAESYAMGFTYRIEDKIDYYPDVYLGRLPFRYSWEPSVIINKIIDYETNTNRNDSWFNRVVIAAGDTSPPARDTSGIIEEGVYEGEISTGLTASYLSADGFTIEKLFTSLGNFDTVNDFVNAVNPGSGFIHVAGHGNPAVWGNFYPDAQTEEEFAYGFTVIDIRKFTNDNKLPVIVIGGCHNGQFNSTMQQLIESVDSGDFTGIGKLEWVPHDTCSWWMLQEGGGSIASIGNTGLGYGYVNDYCTQGLGGWLNPQFFKVYSEHDNDDILGKVHAQAITNYINKEAPAIDGVNKDGIDRKTIEEWVLLGDPTLLLGGYGLGTFDDSNDDDDDSDPSPAASDDVPTWEIGNKWVYQLNNIDFAFSEIEDRDVNIQLSAGDISLTVIEETSSTYITELSASGIDVALDVYFDWYIEGKDPTILELVFSDAELNGEIIFEKDTLGIDSVEATLSIVFDSTELPIELPAFITNIVKTIPVDINFNLEFDESLPLIDFPIETGKKWGIPATTVTIDGNVDSIWLKIANIVNKILKLVGLDFIPPELAGYLPSIDISDILEDMGMSNVFEISEIEEVLRKSPFEAAQQTSVSIDAGSFTAYNILFVQGLGEVYYSPEAKNIVKITGYLNDFIPIVENIDLELVSMS